MRLGAMELMPADRYRGGQFPPRPSPPPRCLLLRRGPRQILIGDVEIHDTVTHGPQLHGEKGAVAIGLGPRVQTALDRLHECEERDGSRTWTLTGSCRAPAGDPYGGDRHLGAEQHPIVSGMFSCELQVRVAPAAERVARVAPRRFGLGKETVEFAKPFLENGQDKALLVLEVAVDGGRSHPGPPRHGPDGESVCVAEFGKKCGCGLDELAPEPLSLAPGIPFAARPLVHRVSVCAPNQPGGRVCPVCAVPTKITAVSLRLSGAVWALGRKPPRLACPLT